VAVQRHPNVVFRAVMTNHNIEVATGSPPMGRRALRKIDPGGLTGHLKAVRAIAASLHRETLFGRATPLEVEVGSARALLRTAPWQPEVNFLGIEVARNTRVRGAGLPRPA